MSPMRHLMSQGQRKETAARQCQWQEVLSRVGALDAGVGGLGQWTAVQVESILQRIVVELRAPARGIFSTIGKTPISTPPESHAAKQ